MSIKKILLAIQNDTMEMPATEVAINLATSYDAGLIGLHVMPVVQLPNMVSGYVPPEVLIEHQRVAEATAVEIKEKFESRTAKAGIRAEWRQVWGDPRAVTPIHAFYVDLVVASQRDRDSFQSAPYELADELVLAVGRPTLVVPFAGKPRTIGQQVMVAWNGTRESTRAVHDAMPVLKRAEKVIVYSINPSDKEHIAGADIAAHLAEHGVNAQAEHTVARDISIGDALLSAAADHGSDLLVMGAYGHSRLRELALGGATRYLLAHMTLPVMLSH